MVKTQIKELLVERYGRESLSSSRWLVNGFNTQEMGKLINDNIVAFQDRMSDFTIMLSNELNKPNEVYVTKDSITVELERTADISATWTPISFTRPIDEQYVSTGLQTALAKAFKQVFAQNFEQSIQDLLITVVLISVVKQL